MKIVRRIQYMFLLPLFLLPPSVGLAADDSAFIANGCPACHQVTPPPADYDIRDRMAEKGPNLWYAGSKFQDGWLANWLAAPVPIASIRYDGVTPSSALDMHPVLSGDALTQVVAYLSTLTDVSVTAGVIDTSGRPSRRVRIQGRMFFSKDQQCFGCHMTRTRYGVLVGGASGPSLASAFERLNPDWVYAFLMDQKRYTPITRMPIFHGETYTEYDAAHMKVLARYIAEMGKVK